ncbi:hypothetical protein ACFLSQ_01520 [Bacteroidota bacterium]
MKRKSYGKLIGILTLLALILPVGSLIGQNLLNETNGTITNQGIIRFVDNAGEFQNEADNTMNVAVDNSSGTISFQGSDNLFAGTNDLGDNADVDVETFRIDGWVIYDGTATQQIQGRFYANLAMNAAGDKNFGAETVLVDHVYTSDRAQTRNYATSLFYYDGIETDVENQTIFPEYGAAAATDAYYELYFKGAGIKTLEASFACKAFNRIDIDADAIVHVQGKLSAEGTAVIFSETSAGGNLLLDGTGGNAGDGNFESYNGEGNYSGDIYAYNDGVFITKGTGRQLFYGTVTVGEDSSAVASSASFTLESGDAVMGIAGGNGVLALMTDAAGAPTVWGNVVVGDGRTLEIASPVGGFTNEITYGSANRENMQFHVNSTTIYSGDAQVVGTEIDFPYGHLTVNADTSGTDAAPEGADGTNGIDVYMAGNLTMNDRNLLMDNDVNPVNGSQILVMLDNQSTVTYSDAADGETEEVIGGFRRYYNSWAGETGDYVGATELTFNNEATTVAINDTETDLNWFAVYTYPGAVLGAAIYTDYNANTDVDRRTYLQSNETGTGWSADFQLGYLTGEEPTPPGGITLAELRASYRFRKYTAGGASKKLATGFNPDRHPAFDVDNFAYAGIQGIVTDPSASVTAAIIDNDGSTYGNEVFLRGGPTWFITVACGRWSNGATWDEGVQPGPNDLTLVRHTVHAGFKRASDNHDVSERTHLATFGAYTESKMASYIQVYSGTVDAVAYNGALLLGSGVTDAGDIADPSWGVNTDFDITGFAFTSPFVATNNTEDPGVAGAITDGYFWVTELSGATANLPNGGDAFGVINDAASAECGIIGGLIVFNTAEFTVPEVYTNHGLLLNGGLVNIGQ